jgi:NADPH:quinone reductase-like Zn-dependent oxidoreductase/acyl carrier protein/SAM-dependent methyltransferase
MVFDGEHARTLRLQLNPRDGSFQIKSRPRLSSDDWALHAAGRVLQPGTRAPAACIDAVATSAQRIEGPTHYTLTEQLGLDYGPRFRGLAQAWVDGERLEAVLSALGEEEKIKGYFIHPALLDVCYQSLVDFFRAEIEAGHGVALLPVKLGRLERYQHGVPSRFRARLLRRSARSVLADFELFDAQGQLIASVCACRFRAAPLRPKAQDSASCWSIVPWLRPHPTEENTVELPSSRELGAQIQSAWSELAEQRGVWFKETLPLFEALVLSFAYEACQTLVARQVDLQRLVASSSPLTRWILGLLRQEGLLHQDAEGRCLLSANADLPAAGEIWRTLQREHPESLPQLALMARIGSQLPQLLMSESDAASFVAGLRGSPVAEMLYEDDPAYAGTRRALEAVLHHLAAHLPAHRRLRVLELAAGASELPRVLLHALPEDRLHYVLALPDDALAERQRAECQHEPRLAVATLDPATWVLDADGPIPEHFDIVILRHVAHQAVSPHAALHSSRRWLAAGGLLVLAERYPDWSADFIAGVDPRWWHEPAHAEAAAAVPLSSLLPPSAWEATLAQQGFDEVRLYKEAVADGLDEGAYLLLAKRPRQDAPALPSPPAASWLLRVDEASAASAEALRCRLASLGQRVELAASLEAHRATTFDHVVYLKGWDATPETLSAWLAEVLADVQSLASLEGRPPRLWFVTRGGALATDLPASLVPNPGQTALWGFGRVVMNEHPYLRCTLIDLAGDPHAADLAARLENELLRPDGANEVVLTDAGRYTLVLREAQNASAEPARIAERFRLDFPWPGQLRNLVWVPQSEPVLGEHEVEVRVQATGLNFRDVMYLMGLLPDEAVEKGFAGASLGLEFSGIVTRVGARVRDLQAGDQVMGFGPACFASHVVTRADAVALMPDEWSFETAATVPTVFFTVYYALRHLADLQAGERVLIHGGAGGVGIAAIQLAKHVGAEVFATAGSEEKRDFVRLLGADHVFDSRSLEFAEDILAATQGQGVDVVLNSLAGEAIRRNLAVLKPFGRFLELGKRDFFENTPIGLRPFKDNISYFGIDADQLLTARPQLAARLFREVMALFREGVLTPLPCRVFSAERVVDAFRVMQQARHIGKVVVSLAQGRPAVQPQAAVPKPLQLSAEGTWLVSGGLSGFGLASARWLAAHGVRHLALVGRRGLQTPGAKDAVQALADQGVQVRAYACDIADAQAVAGLIEDIVKTLPPLRGVLHGAAIFDDALLQNLDGSRMEQVIAPKARGAWNLHQATLHIPLEHFVLYSSVTTAIGNPGQANYVAANAALEGLADMRRRMGLPALCIGWGPIGDAGYLARNETVRDSLAQRLGKPPLAAAQALDRLGQALAENRSITIAHFDWSTLARLLPSASSSRFGVLNRSLKHHAASADDIDFRALIAGKTPDEVASLVQQMVIQELAQILAISPERIEPSRSLHDLGLDSLMAVELALGLERRLGIQLPVMMLNESPSAEKVTQRIVEKLLGAADPESAPTPDAVVRSLATQHGEAVAAEEIAAIVEETRRLTQQGTRLTR